MKKDVLKNKLYIVLGIVIAIVIALNLLNRINLNSVKSDILIKKNKLVNLKKACIDEKLSNFYSLNSIQGSEDYIALTFKDYRYNGEFYKNHIIYDNKNNKYVKSIEHKDIVVHLRDASVIQYIDENKFLIIDSRGKVYIYQPDKSDKVVYIGDTSISKKRAFKYIYNGSIRAIA